jgi:hypothetical protein
VPARVCVEDPATRQIDARDGSDVDVLCLASRRDARSCSVPKVFDQNRMKFGEARSLLQRLLQGGPDGGR